VTTLMTSRRLRYVFAALEQAKLAQTAPTGVAAIAVDEVVQSLRIALGISPMPQQGEPVFGVRPAPKQREGE
jgi:hypothetical protein